MSPTIISAITPVYDWVIDRFLGGEMRIRKRMAEKVSDFERGLDIGCGTGSFMAVLRAMKSGELYGMDISRRMVRHASKKYGDTEFLVGSALNLPFGDSSFDAVFSTMMMHHLTDKERAIACSEILRVLRKGGTYYSLEFHRDGLTGTGKAVTRLGFLEDRHLEGFEMLEKESWDEGLVFRRARKPQRIKSWRD